jgi:hypothetical protein
MMRDELVGRPRTLSPRNEVVASPMQSDGHVKEGVVSVLSSP